MFASPATAIHWADPRQRTGWDGEIAAARWLVARGWQIEAHRWRLGRHDLDLIVRREAIVSFVEVKARRSHRFGGGEEAVGRRKQRVIERVAWSWILKCGASADIYRFDVIVLARRNDRWLVRHIPDAWRPGWR